MRQGLRGGMVTTTEERTLDHRDQADRIRHLEAQVDAWRQRVAVLEAKLGEREGNGGQG